MGSARCLCPSRPKLGPGAPLGKRLWEASAHQADWVWWTGPGVGWTCLTASLFVVPWLGDSVHVLLSCHRLYRLSGRQGKCPVSFLVLGEHWPQASLFPSLIFPPGVETMGKGQSVTTASTAQPLSPACPFRAYHLIFPSSHPKQHVQDGRKENLEGFCEDFEKELSGDAHPGVYASTVRW